MHNVPDVYDVYIDLAESYGDWITLDGVMSVLEITRASVERLANDGWLSSRSDGETATYLARDVAKIGWLLAEAEAVIPTSREIPAGSIA